MIFFLKVKVGIGCFIDFQLHFIIILKLPFDAVGLKLTKSMGKYTIIYDRCIFFIVKVGFLSLFATNVINLRIL